MLSEHETMTLTPLINVTGKYTHIYSLDSIAASVLDGFFWKNVPVATFLYGTLLNSLNSE